jgi:hypothetical protein
MMVWVRMEQKLDGVNWGNFYYCYRNGRGYEGIKGDKGE